MTSPLSTVFAFPSSHDLVQLKNGLLVVAPFFVTLCVLYHLLAPLYPSAKQRSWIVTAISSSVMTLCSIPFLWDYLSSGGSVKGVRTVSTLALAANRFFQAHLLADSAMGALYYRDQVALLTGWVHHIVYLFIVEMAIRRSWAPVFCLCASMELPTFILASTILHPRYRSNLLFAVAFFMTRIMLHIVLCISYLLPHNRAKATGGSLIPGTILILVFPLHAFWFYGCLKGFVKRARAKSASALQPTSSPVVTPLDVPPEKCADVQATQRETEIAQPIPPTRHSFSQSLNEWRHSSMTMPGSFSLPPLRLRLSVQRLSPKHRRSSVREPLDSSATLRTPSSERARADA